MYFLVPRLGRVCPKLPAPDLNWTHSLPVRTRFPASSVPLVWGTFGRPCSWLLVPRESGTQPTISGSRQCAGKESRPTPVDQPHPYTSRGKRCGYLLGTSDCACLAGNSVPDLLAPSPSWNKSIQSPTDSNCLLSARFTPHSMCHYLNPSLLLFP